jgi:hypothetical protein
MRAHATQPENVRKVWEQYVVDDRPKLLSNLIGVSRAILQKVGTQFVLTTIRCRTACRRPMCNWRMNSFAAHLDNFADMTLREEVCMTLQAVHTMSAACAHITRDASIILSPAQHLEVASGVA